MKIRTYVITSDGGGAPNYDSPSVTLALCKPRIRKHAEPGELVLAFAGRKLGTEPHGVRWAGVVKEKLSFAEYWNDRRYQSKKPGSQTAMPDNIYRPVAGRLIQERNATHSRANTAVDLGGENVLVFGQNWRFGPTSPVLPAEFGLRMARGRRGERKHDVDDATWRRLKAWLDSNCPDTPAENRVRNCASAKGTTGKSLSRSIGRCD